MLKSVGGICHGMRLGDGTGGGQQGELLSTAQSVAEAAQLSLAACAGDEISAAVQRRIGPEDIDVIITELGGVVGTDRLQTGVEGVFHVVAVNRLDLVNGSGVDVAGGDVPTDFPGNVGADLNEDVMFRNDPKIDAACKQFRSESAAVFGNGTAEKFGGESAREVATQTAHDRRIVATPINHDEEVDTPYIGGIDELKLGLVVLVVTEEAGTDGNFDNMGGIELELLEERMVMSELSKRIARSEGAAVFVQRHGSRENQTERVGFVGVSSAELVAADLLVFIGAVEGVAGGFGGDSLVHDDYLSFHKNSFWKFQGVKCGLLADF